MRTALFRLVRRAIGLGVALLAACAGPALQVGQNEAAVLAAMGQPTGRYALPDGAQRLEYATGPYGRHTWMVDLDPAGRVQRWAQVLNETRFAEINEGMSRADLLRLIGRPGHRAGEWMNRETWSWRYPTNDCLWFRVTLLPDGTVQGGGYLPDPMCMDRERGR